MSKQIKEIFGMIKDLCVLFKFYQVNLLVKNLKTTTNKQGIGHSISPYWTSFQIAVPYNPAAKYN